MTEKTVTVSRIHCGNCARTIQRELSEIPGVAEVRTDPATKLVTVRFDAPADWPAIARTLADIGFPPDGD